MNSPCGNAITCPGTDSPVANFSSESEEVFSATAVGYCCNGSLLTATADSVIYAESLLLTEIVACDPCPTELPPCDLSEFDEYWIMGEEVNIRIRIGCDITEDLFYVPVDPLPPGLTLNGNKLAGTLTTPGDYTFTIRASPKIPVRSPRPKRYRMKVMDLIPSPLSPGIVGYAYNEVVDVLYALGPFQYTLLGDVPPGLNFAAPTIGVITGTPTVAGTYNTVIRVDDMGTGKSALFSRPITVIDACVESGWVQFGENMQAYCTKQGMFSFPPTYDPPFGPGKSNPLYCRNGPEIYNWGLPYGYDFTPDQYDAPPYVNYGCFHGILGWYDASVIAKPYDAKGFYGYDYFGALGTRLKLTCDSTTGKMTLRFDKGANVVIWEKSGSEPDGTYTKISETSPPAGVVAPTTIVATWTNTIPPYFNWPP